MSTRLKRNYFFPITLIVAGFALILGSMWWFFTVTPAMPISTATASGARLPSPSIARVSVADAKAAFDLGIAVFVDVRGETFYNQEHIPGAISIPEDELEQKVNVVDPQSWIITYCT